MLFLGGRWSIASLLLPRTRQRSLLWRTLRWCGEVLFFANACCLLCSSGCPNCCATAASCFLCTLLCLSALLCFLYIIQLFQCFLFGSRHFLSSFRATFSFAAPRLPKSWVLPAAHESGGEAYCNYIWGFAHALETLKYPWFLKKIVASPDHMHVAATQWAVSRALEVRNASTWRFKLLSA